MLRRGWIVELDDGKILSEEDVEWREVPKIRIKKLSLLFDGRRWDLFDKQAYFIRNSASVVPGVQESFQIEKRTIGYYEGAEKVSYTINEMTGEFKITID
jgi:hypothetical protein